MSSERRPPGPESIDEESSDEESSDEESSDEESSDEESSDEESSCEDRRVSFFIPALGIDLEVLVFYLKRFLGHDSAAEPGQHPKNPTQIGYYAKSRYGLSRGMMKDIKRDSVSWSIEELSNLRRQRYSDSSTAHKRVRRGPSGPLVDPPGLPPKTRTSAIAEAYKLGGISENTNTSLGPSNGLSQTPRYPQTDSGYGASEPSVYEPATFQNHAGSVSPSRNDWEKKKSIIHSLYIEHGLSLVEVANRMRQEHDFEASVRMYKSRLSRWGFHKNVSRRDWNIAAEVSRLVDGQPADCSTEDGFMHEGITGAREAYGSGVIMKHSKVSISNPDSAMQADSEMQEVFVKAEIELHRSSIVTYKSDYQNFVEFPRKKKAAEVPKLPSPELNSPTSISSSEGENSFMESIDSDEAAHIWETELDPRLHSLRSKLIKILVASYIDTASLAVNSQTTQYLAAANSPSGHAKSSSTSSSSSLSDTKPSSASTGKRRRNHDSNDNNNDEDHEDQQRQPSRKKLRHTSTSISIDGRLLACPYCKYDATRYSERNIEERNYRGCSSIYLTSISRVKQHLYRVHKRPDYYCACCFGVYQDEAALSAHSRIRPACEVKEACFTEKMATEQVNFIKRRTIGKTPSETWFDIYKILFPHAPLPETPYVETVSPGAIQRFTDHFYRQAGSRLAALVQTELQGRMLLERDQQRILDSALESAIGQLVWQTGPHTSSEDAEPDMNVAHSEADSAASSNLQASRENIQVHEQQETSLDDQLLPTQANLDFRVNTDDPYSLYNNLRPTFTGQAPIDGHEDQNSYPVLSDPLEDGGLNDWFDREFSN